MVEKGGHVDAPHWRSVGQQPPPWLGAQERKPYEHAKAVEAEDEGAVEVIGVVGAIDDEDMVIAEDIGNEVEEISVVDCNVVVLESRKRVTVGVTITVAVDMRTPGNEV